MGNEIQIKVEYGVKYDQIFEAYTLFVHHHLQKSTVPLRDAIW